MKRFILANFRRVVLLAMLWPACGLGAAYDPVMRTLPLSRHLTLDDVLDSGIRPRKLSLESLQRFRVAIGSVRLDFGGTSFEFKDYGIGLSFSGTGVLIEMDLQSQGIRDAPTVAGWFADWSRAMGVPNPFPEEALRGLSGYEDVGSITGLFKEYGAYAIGIAPRAVGTDLGNGRRYAADATVVIFADGKPLHLPVVFASALPTEKYRSLNLEPYSREELYELQEVTNSHNEEWLGIPRESPGDYKKMIESVRRGPGVPPSPRPSGTFSPEPMEPSRSAWRMWALLGLLVVVGASWLTKRRVPFSLRGTKS